MTMLLHAKYLTVLCCIFLVQIVWSEIEVDVSWSFSTNLDTEGWGNASSSQSNIIISSSNGVLVGNIIGTTPVLDSPNLFLPLTTESYAVIRMQYKGVASSAQLLLRSGATWSPSQQLPFNTQYWTARQAMKIVSDSGTITDHSSSLILDGSDYTYYSSSTTQNAYIIFDLGDFRKITGIRMTALGTSSNESPKRCYLQYSITSGVGPFQTAVTFTGTNTLDEQSIVGFTGYARYWKLIMLDNYGGSHISVREVHLDGYDENVTPVPITLISSLKYETYYLPIHNYLNGNLLRMRMQWLYPASTATLRETFQIDYIDIVRGPVINTVTGCLTKYHNDASYATSLYNVTTVIDVINGNLPLYSFIDNGINTKYKTTYNCPLQGGTVIAVQGTNFGDNPNVYVNNQNCTFISNTYDETDGRQQTVLCTLPELTPGTNTSKPLGVKIQNSVYPGLTYEVFSLQFAVAPPVCDQPNVTNIAATKVDLVWKPPGDQFQQMTITGYKIMWFQPKFRSMPSNITVGNVTTTSIRGLQPGTEYVFAIAAVNEGQGHANDSTDLYGRRDLTTNALIGPFSIFTNITATLPFDFDFSFFNSNQTLNASSISPVKSLGPTGLYGGEGNYGLVMVGTANIQNCNVSSTCCDGYNATIGELSCGTGKTVCAVFATQVLAYDLVINGVTRRSVPTNLPYSNGAPPEINIMTLEELKANKGAEVPSSACGPALRLTNSAARQSGSAWYNRMVNVREGFDTSIKFQISNPSQKCDRLDDVNTYCRSRGADGFAFVIQHTAVDALGNSGSGLGYEGIYNALAVEMDTYHNYDQMDYYENHISVQTNGFRYNITANHSRSLATTNRIPDLTDGIHTVRIKYDPNLDENALLHPSFQTNGFTTWFLNNADFANGGEGDWGTGFGLLYVYLDDMYSPVITTPLNLGATINLDNGRSLVGLTAATGDNYWQAHDILEWQFTSLYIDERYTAPFQLNGEGAYSCVNETVCVHRVDYDHYMRKNNVWGAHADSTEGWQNGQQGYCAFC